MVNLKEMYKYLPYCCMALIALLPIIILIISNSIMVLILVVYESSCLWSNVQFECIS